jgi:glycosyltransferase involved in cell wall biosynthesis
MTRVSVVIPCYQDVGTLGRALDSVARQTRRPDETIVVDDGSPEAAAIRAIVDARPEVRYVRNETNAGLAAARNRGWREASGDVVAFLDADDEAHPQRLELQLREIAPGIAVTCGVLRANAGALPELERYESAAVARVRGIGTMAYANRLCGAALMAPVELLRASGGYDESLRSCEDYDLWLRLLARGTEVREVLLPLYIYHFNSAGLSRRYRDIAGYELAVVRKLLDSGGVGNPDSARAGSVLAVWLLRHALRAERVGDPVLRADVESNLRALLAPRWPWLTVAVRLCRALGLHRLAFPKEPA